MNRLKTILISSGILLSSTCFASPSDWSHSASMAVKPGPIGITDIIREKVDFNSDGTQQLILAPTLSPGVTYHGGQVMINPVVYYIYYGNWTGSADVTTIPLINEFTSNLGGSPYWNINTTYYQNINSNKTYVTNQVTFGGSVFDSSYTYGASLTDSAVYYIIRDNIKAGKLPLNPAGIYFVVSSPDVTNTSGFCTSYCAFHTASSLNSVSMKYGYIGHTSRCPRACQAQSISPNNNPAADAMISMVAHEIEEAVTDPTFSSWYNSSSYENADLCAWKFGTTYTLPNGSRANMRLQNGKDYLVQTNWLNFNGMGYCEQAYNPPIAKITATSSPQGNGLNFTLDGTNSYDPNASNSIASYTWDFGDGSPTIQGAVATHYYRAGTYSAQLTVTNQLGVAGYAAYKVSVPDIEPPTAPQNLVVTLTSTSPGKWVAALRWTASSDNMAVSIYEIYRNNILIGRSYSPSYSDSTTSQNSTYNYFVIATDAAGNRSAASNIVTITR